MASDFFDLARLTAPRMRGDAPIGSSATAGREYGEDRARHISALSGAGDLASLRSSMENMAADETKAGSPGRLADIGTNNALAAGRAAQVGDLTQTQSDTIKTGAIKADAGRISAEREKLMPYVNDWSQAKTPEAKEAIKSRMDSDGIILGKRKMGDIPTDKLDMVFGPMRSSAINTPGQAQKLQVEDVKGKYGVQKAETAADSRVDVAKIQAETQKLKINAQKTYLELKQAGPKTMSQWEAGQREKMDKGLMTPEEQKSFVHYMTFKLTDVATRAANSNPQLNPAAMEENAPPGTPLMVPPTVPKPPAIPPQNGKVPKMINGKKVVAEGYDEDAGKFQLQDGTVVDKDGKEIK